MEALDAFDYIVLNRADRLDDAVAQIQAIVAAEKLRVHPRHVVL
jgi:guanylate kinase